MGACLCAHVSVARLDRWMDTRRSRGAGRACQGSRTCCARGYMRNVRCAKLANLGCALFSGSTKCSISICVNSRTRSNPALGEISLRKLCPICAAANGNLPPLKYSRSLHTAHTRSRQRRRPAELTAYARRLRGERWWGRAATPRTGS